MSGSQQEVNEQTEHGEQECHREILRRAEDAQLGRDGLDERERRAGDDSFTKQRGDGEQQRAAAVCPWVAMPQGRNSAKPMQA